MKIHEYQAKALFHEFGIPAKDEVAVSSPDEALTAVEKVGLPAVLKAQVHAGGRGKAGGVKLVREKDEVAPTAETILGLRIKDLPVRKLLVAPAVDIRKEVYLSLLVDRGKRTAVFVGCSEGGVEIEETAKTAPEKILRFEVAAADLAELAPQTCLPFASRLFDDPEQADQAAQIMCAMAGLYRARDCELIEINPLIVDGDGTVLALDAKVLLDDNALFRQPENEALRDMEAEDLDELEAKKSGLSFIRLDGTIGCMVNGAGLAMATMDIIKHFGGKPANFLDVGGSSNPEKVVVAFQTILKDPKVKLILVNIFGGITRCDDIAQGLLTAKERMDISVPIVVRLVGTNQEEGRALLGGADVGVARTLEEGARTVVERGKVA